MPPPTRGSRTLPPAPELAGAQLAGTCLGTVGAVDPAAGLLQVLTPVHLGAYSPSLVRKGLCRGSAEVLLCRSLQGSALHPTVFVGSPTLTGDSRGGNAFSAAALHP